jgi:hypothetical protein
VPGDILATGEIGYLGYYSDMTILDVAGLVSPQLRPFVKQGYYESLARTIAAYSPDYVLVADHPTAVGILSDDARYALVERIQPAYLIYHLEE